MNEAECDAFLRELRIEDINGSAGAMRLKEELRRARRALRATPAASADRHALPALNP